MKTGKKMALALGIGAGAVLAALATKSQKRVQNLLSKFTRKVEKYDEDDDSYAQYI